MIKTFYFRVIVVCGQIFQPCNAMEPKTQHPILQIIKGIEEPSCGHFIDPKTIIISHKEGSTIHHLPTNTVLKKISDIPSPHLALHPNRKLCALTYAKEVKIYSIQMATLKWQPHEAAHFNQISDFIASILKPLDPHIMTLQKGDCGIIDCNYKTGGWTSRVHGHNGQLAPTIAFHPNEKIMCHAQNEGYISFHSTIDFRITVPPISIVQPEECSHTFCQFSPDGFLLVEGNKEGFCIRDKDNYKSVAMGNIHEIIFHPNGKFVITLSQPNNKITYWDITDTHLNRIISIPCSSNKENPVTEHKHMHTYLSCDPHGEKLLVILSKQCLILSIPFRLIYEPQAREECIFAYFALQAHLPKDIRQVLIRELLTLCKR